MLSLADSNEPKYLIWSSSNSNKIKLHDLETKSECGEFQGAQAAGMATTWTHIRELGDTNMILSACYPNGSLDFANFEVFEISRGKLIPTFLFSKLDGVKGRGDLTYNKRRNFAALIPIQKNIAYHLFDCTTLKIICRSKWQKVHGDQIESFDLDSSGRRIATLIKEQFVRSRISITTASILPMSNSISHKELIRERIDVDGIHWLIAR